MAFVLPTFNLDFNVWHAPRVPTDGGPDDSGTCQLRGADHTAACVNPNETLAAGNYALFPPLQDLRDLNSPSGTDVIEIPAGSLRYYRVLNVDDIAKGFDNEHRFAILTKWNDWPVPIP